MLGFIWYYTYKKMPLNNFEYPSLKSWAHRCLEGAGERLPASLARRRVAEFVLTVMEGAVMQARTYRDIGYFDRNIAMLRDQFDRMMREAEAERVAA